MIELAHQVAWQWKKKKLVTLIYHDSGTGWGESPSKFQTWFRRWQLRWWGVRQSWRSFSLWTWAQKISRRTGHQPSSPWCGNVSSICHAQIVVMIALLLILSSSRGWRRRRWEQWKWRWWKWWRSCYSAFNSSSGSNHLWCFPRIGHCGARSGQWSKRFAKNRKPWSNV